MRSAYSLVIASMLSAGSVPAFADSLGWAVGAGGTILHTSNGGSTWSPQISGTTNGLGAVTFVDADNGWAVGAGGTILHTSNGGGVWSPQTSRTERELEFFGYLNGVTFVDANNGWAVGGLQFLTASGGIILHTSNGGSTWSPQNPSSSIVLRGVSFVDANNGWAVGGVGVFNEPGVDFGIILHTSNGGSTWSPQEIPIPTILRGVSFVDANNGWAVGVGGGLTAPPFGLILHTSNGGATWSPQISGTTNGLGAVTFVDANNGWAVGDSGTILHTSNGGSTWSPQISGTTNFLIYSAVTFVDANNGWAVGDSGTILHTSNGGSTWSPQSSGTTQSLFGVTFLNAPPVVVDTTPPVIVPQISGTLGNNGWYRSNVTVSWSVTDPESGIASSSGCNTTTLTADTAGVTLTCSATNGAGLSSSVPGTIKIDKTPPVISGIPAPGCTLWPPNHRLVQVATVTAADALSGLAPGSFKITGTSNEQFNNRQIVITPNGSGGFVVQLQADRMGTGTGRVYTLTATAADLAGNPATATATCTVPHDQGN